MHRLSPSLFKIPTDKIRTGYYTDKYFLRVRDILFADKLQSTVGYQFFPRKDAVICGLDEAIAILKSCAGYYRDFDRAKDLYEQLRIAQWKLQDAGAQQREKQIFKWEKQRTDIRHRLNMLWRSGWDRLQVYAAFDGRKAREDETVLAIVGDPKLFVHLETALLGAIARPTSTATSVDKVVRAARPKKILFFSARFDHYWLQATDGYAALKAGAFGVSTDANADYWGIEGIGTMPHFLIGCYAGNTGEACLAFDRHVEADVNRIALVDWDNDCVGTTRLILEKLLALKYPGKEISHDFFKRHAGEVVGAGRGKLWGVRFDTAGSIRDKSVKSRGKKSYGVCPELVRIAKREFVQWGCRSLKIVVSGGFDEEKIKTFEKLKLPVDAYGIGSSLFRNKIDITADIVECDGKPCMKVGRKKGNWSKLPRVF